MRTVFRVWVGGQQVAGAEHTMTDVADVLGVTDLYGRYVHDQSAPWLVEVEFPELPARSGLLRFGTTTMGLHDPDPILVAPQRTIATRGVRGMSVRTAPSR